MGKIIIAGGTGLIGSALSAELVNRGHQVLLLSRSPREGRIVWDGVHSGEWAENLLDCQTVINLAGSPISVKFTSDNRREILKSRLEPTGAIGDAIQTTCHNVAPPHWINASAVGFYGNRSDEVCTEESLPGKGFLAATSVQWEKACLDHPASCPKSIVRIGVVLAHGGGAFPKLQSLTKALLGGQIGDGEQFISWIHLADLVTMFCWLIESRREGIYNGTAPNPVKNQDFMSELRKAESRPWSPPVPAPLLRLMGGTSGPDASLLLDSTRAIPAASVDQGFTFRFPTIQEALQDLCTK